jgi:pimeloyl-ACP methyl ester carboxylesterase
VNIATVTEKVRQRSVGRRLTLVVSGFITLLLALVVTIYVWPLGSSQLQAAPVKTFTLSSAVNQASEVLKADADDPFVRPECRSSLLSHGQKTAKAIVLLHGYTACPSQFSQLAELYFRVGYNVWVPRAPDHGLTDTSAHAQVNAAELVTYANDAMNVAVGLGDEVGVAGISGGAVLATWLAAHRPEAVQRILLLSPFYVPSRSQAPPAVVKPLIVLYGFRILPDHVSGQGFSFAALSQYLRIARSNSEITSPSGRLKSVAVVTSANDSYIDRDKAVAVARHLADTNHLPLSAHELPAALGIGHDIVDPPDIKGHVDELDDLYFSLYEGTRKD